MTYFQLPNSTEVQKFIPKNAFDNYINSKQKKLFTAKIQRITWTHKLSVDTINLIGENIEEIQIFKIELKEKTEINAILKTIDKVIPYHLIFWVEFDNEFYLSASAKHLHPTKENISVIDWTFLTDWMLFENFLSYPLQLKKSLDAVFKNFCLQISDTQNLAQKSMVEIVSFQKEIAELEHTINRLKGEIKRTRQFNQKVELNMKLVKNEEALKRLIRP